jgi:hypothetical protein
VGLSSSYPQPVNELEPKRQPTTHQRRLSRADHSAARCPGEDSAPVRLAWRTIRASRTSGTSPSPQDKAAAALNHPNICTIHEVGEDEGLGFIAMELVEGVALQSAVPPGTGLSPDRRISQGVPTSV